MADKKLTEKMNDAIREFKAGNFLIVVDDETRENEGDLIIAAEKATPAKINFMAKHGRGLICVSMEKERLNKLGIGPMVTEQEELYGCKFTVSVDAKKGTTTGISAHDRAETIRQLISPTAKPADFKRPGHIFPLIAELGGVLKRAGHTESAVDLSRLAKLYPSGVICEIMSDDGTMARLPELQKFAKLHKIKIISVQDIIEYRRIKENFIEKVAEADLPTAFGNFRVHVYRNKVTGEEVTALVKGEITGNKPTLVRVHSECLTGDAFLSRKCDCGAQLHTAMKMIEKEGCGAILYLRQEGRGIGIANKIRAYELQDKGYDTVEANLKLGFKDDLRDYGTGAQVLAYMGIHKLRLITNNPLKVIGLKGYGLEIVDRVPIKPGRNIHNVKYLLTKKDRMGHYL